MDCNLLIGIDMRRMIFRLIRYAVPLVLLAALTGCAGGSRSSPATLPEATPKLAAELSARLYDRFFMEGSLLQMHGEYAGAIREYRRALRFDSTRGSLHYALARCYQALSAPDSALQYSRSAVAASPGNVDARILLAEIYLASGNIAESIDNYNVILGLDPGNVQARLMVARSLQRRDPFGAIEQFEQIRRIVGDELEILYTLTRLYLDNGLLDKAVQTLRTILYAGPDQAATYRLMSQTMLGAFRYRDAALLLEEAALQIPGDSARQAYHLLQIQDLNERLEQTATPPAGLVEFGTTLALQTRRFAYRWEGMFESGMLLYRLRDPNADSILVHTLAYEGIPPSAWNAAAVRLLEDHRTDFLLNQLAPQAGRFRDDPSISFTLGRAWRLAGRSDSAERYLRRAAAADPGNSDAWLLLADTYLANGKIVAGNAALQRALDEDPGNPDALDRMALSLAERKESLDEALRLSRSALEAEPENERFLQTLGLIHYLRDDPARALPFLENAAAAGGAGPELLELLGDVHTALGDRAAARQAFQRALRLAPDDERLKQKSRDK